MRRPTLVLAGALLALVLATPLTAAPRATIAVTLNGGGNVTSSPKGIDCPPTCSFNFTGTVTLTASPDAGWNFNGWGGSCSGGRATCTIDSRTAKTVVANFSRIQPALTTLTVTKQGSGGGTVSGGGVNCGGTCTISVNPGTKVTLTAVADSLSRFSGWGGACAGTAATAKCGVTVSSDTTATARFEARRILFTSYRDGNGEIYEMNPDGNQETNLTTNPALDLQPARSPNGLRVAFASNRGGDGLSATEIYAMSSDGTGVTRLTTNDAFDGQPVWSPNGKRIAFVSLRDGNAELYVMNDDGSGQTRLTRNPGLDVTPDWSPNGKQLAFASARLTSSSSATEIYVVNASGLNLRRLTRNTFFDYEPAWSPAGDRLVFTSLRDGEPGLFVVPTAGGPDNAAEASPAADEAAAWVPDGSQLVFASDRSGPRVVGEELYVGGPVPRRLTTNGAVDTEPDW